MRARMALFQAGVTCEIREVVLKRKPAELLAVSPKATVPVLQLPDGTVLDESLDIMLWALQQNDPEQWLSPEGSSLQDMLKLIEGNDGDFKYHLDRYKYPDRFDLEPSAEHRDLACEFLANLEASLKHPHFLFGERCSLADVAIFPFVRQFARTDMAWFEHSGYPHLRSWLALWQESDLFAKTMTKFPAWQAENAPVILR